MAKNMTRSKYLIYLDNKYKITFDLCISAVLLFICAVLPLQIALATGTSTTWATIFNIADIIFLVDLILNFFTCLYDDEKNTEITDRKLIALDYLKGWFLIDFLSIVPFEQLMSVFIGNNKIDNG